MLTLFKDPFFNPFEGILSKYHYDNLPQANINKNDNGYMLQMAVPGLTSDDLEIKVKDDSLTISYEKEEKNENSYFMSNFVKSYWLPDNIDSDKIKGKVENGLLKINVPFNKKKITEKLIELE
jgi:HSP20 family protein